MDVGFWREIALFLTGNYKNHNVRTQLLHFTREIVTVHSGHVYVGDQHVKVAAFLFSDSQCSGPVRRFQHMVAGVRQHLYGSVAENRVIFRY